MLVKIFALAVTGTLITVVLKRYCRELVPFFEIALVAVALYIICDADLFGKSGIEKLLSLYSGAEDAFSVLIKGAGISVMTRLACDVCRESGNTLMADIVELGGRIMLIVLAAPFIEKTMGIALSFSG